MMLSSHCKSIVIIIKGKMISFFPYNLYTYDIYKEETTEFVQFKTSLICHDYLCAILITILHYFRQNALTASSHSWCLLIHLAMMSSRYIYYVDFSCVCF